MIDSYQNINLDPVFFLVTSDSYRKTHYNKRNITQYRNQNLKYIVKNKIKIKTIF